MNRREFAALLGGLSAWPALVDAQEAKLPLVGFFSVRSAAEATEEVAMFQRGLLEGGFTENQNVRVEYRWGEGRYDRLQAQVDELINMRVSVIASFGPVPALAAKSRTQTIPIVFTSSADPVKIGLVDSLSRPSANLTGISYLAVDLGLKRLELLHELMPEAKAVGFIVNPAYPDADFEIEELTKAGEKLGVAIRVEFVRDENAISDAFAMLKQHSTSAVMINGDAFFNRIRRSVVNLADRNQLPAIYPWKGYVAEGGLLSYGPSLSDGFRQAGVYISKILKGAKAADLPVVQPTKFDLAINLATAKALGLAISPAMLARADEVIE